MGIGTASLEEIVWVTLSLIALGLNIMALHAAHHDLQVVRRSRRNGRYLRRAIQLRRTELGRVMMQGLFSAIGIVAMCVPDPVGMERTTAQWISRGILWSMQIALVIGAYLDSRDRAWLVRNGADPASIDLDIRQRGGK